MAEQGCETHEVTAAAAVAAAAPDAASELGQGGAADVQPGVQARQHVQDQNCKRFTTDACF